MKARMFHSFIIRIKYWKKGGNGEANWVSLPSWLIAQLELQEIGDKGFGRTCHQGKIGSEQRIREDKKKRRKHDHLPEGEAHCPAGRGLAFRSVQLLALERVLRGLLPFLTRPNIPRPAPEMPLLFTDEPCKAPYCEFPRVSFCICTAASPADMGTALPSDVEWELPSDESPAVGIFRFFLLFVFSYDSYPSVETSVDRSIEFGCRVWSICGVCRGPDRLDKTSGGDLGTMAFLGP